MTTENYQCLIPLPIRFDRGTHYRAKIGIINLVTNQTIEDDLFSMVPHGVGLHFCRMPLVDAGVRGINVKSLTDMSKVLCDAAGLILPDPKAELDVICYACTSGSFVVGDEEILSALTRGRDIVKEKFKEPGATVKDVKVTSLVTGCVRALNFCNARRLVVLTPYLDEINLKLKEYLNGKGFEVLSIYGLNLEKGLDIFRVSPDYILECAVAIDRPDADAIFISCGAFRAIGIIDKLEEMAKKPVVTSNQAMMWDTLRLAGISDKIVGFGCLFREC